MPLYSCWVLKPSLLNLHEEVTVNSHITFSSALVWIQPSPVFTLKHMWDCSLLTSLSNLNALLWKSILELREHAAVMYSLDLKDDGKCDSVFPTRIPQMRSRLLGLDFWSSLINLFLLYLNITRKLLFKLKSSLRARTGC